MKPMITKKEYLKWGVAPYRFQAFICPACGSSISAGPDYQPKFCAECGVKLDFDGIVYEKEERLC